MNKRSGTRLVSFICSCIMGVTCVQSVGAVTASKEYSANMMTDSASEELEWNGQGTEESPYEISNVEEFKKFEAEVENGNSFEGVYFRLTSDLTIDESDDFDGIGAISASQSIPSKEFAGVFDGDNKTITLDIDKTSQDAFTLVSLGLFNSISSDSAVIKNVNVKAAALKCYTRNSLGGIVGMLYAGTIENCTFEGYIKGFSNVGGIVGRQGGVGTTVVKNCATKEGSLIENESELTFMSSPANHIGGIAGYAFAGAILEGCVNYADVSTKNSTGAGGIAGRNYNGSRIENCENYGHISGGGTTGGISGNVTAHNSADGSAYGNRVNDAYIINSTNYGLVTSEEGIVGAIAGILEPGGVINDCKNENADIKKLVGAYSIQLKLYSNGVPSDEFSDVYLYGSNETKHNLNAYQTNESSPTYPGPFYRCIRQSNDSGYPNLYNSVASGKYALYINGQYSGYKLQTDNKEILIDTDIKLSENQFNIDTNDDNNIEFSLHLPDNVNYVGISRDENMLNDNECSYDAQSKKCIIYGEYLKKLGVGAYDFLVVTDEEGFEPLALEITISNKPKLLSDNVIYDLRTSSANHKNIEFTFENVSDDTDISQVLVNGSAIDAAAYTYSKDTHICTIKTTEMPSLEVGEYNIEFVLNDDSNTSLKAVMKVNKTRRSSSGGSKRATAVTSTPAPTPTPKPTLLPTASPAQSIKPDKNEMQTIDSETPSLVQLTKAMEQTDGKILVCAENKLFVYKAFFNALKTNNRGIDFEVGDIEISVKKEVCAELAERIGETELFELTMDSGKLYMSIGGTKTEITVDGGKAEISAKKIAECIGTEYAFEFKDVKSGSWYYDSVMNTAQKGILLGINDEYFGVSENMTRAMFITALWRVMGAPIHEASKFQDVEMNTWYSDAVSWASAANIANGFEDNTFCPNNSITREQVATMIYRCFAADEIKDSLAYEDSQLISDYAKQAVAWTGSIGIMIGDDNNMFNPASFLSRAEEAAIMERLDNYIITLNERK